MAEVVAAPPRGLELFAAGRRAQPLRVTGKRAEALGKLGITSVQDLLQHYPRRHVDRSTLRTVAELQRAAAEGSAEGEVTVHARVQKMGRPVALRPKPNVKKRRTLIKGRIGDETGSIEVTWFNQDWVARALQDGTEAFFYGRLGTFKGKLQMTAPRFEIVRSGKEPFNVGRIIPIYPATADLSSDQLRKLIWETLESVDQIMDPVPDDVVARHRFLARGDALRSIHFPDERDEVLAARRRIVFDEVFTLQLGLVYRKRKLERTVQGVSHVAVGSGSLAEVFLAELPFTPTTAQRRACDEVAVDMVRSCPMHRLIEGEVGSGKTVVALYACLIAIEGGHQAALMAPTEVLAEQHHLTVTELLDRAFGADEARHLFAGVSRRPVVRLLTGSTPAAQRDKVLEEVASGEVNLLIGTHALIQEAVSFKDLGVAVVDEQHRFGVHQRKMLREKRSQGISSNERRDPKGTGRVPGARGEPDMLVMTATPIPRTLAVTIYGDLDVSILDELPKGRQPIDTSLAAGDDAREDAYQLIRDEVAAGRQAFIVYALRDESDKIELRSAKAEAVRLAEEVFPDLAVGLVHGDMRSDEKENAMATFRSGETQVLVATTVVEVGVDVPNATIMLIEDADRFGLAQLHQLRGRIGRGEHRSYCILATDLDLSKAAEDAAIALAAERLDAVVATSDGFKLSLVDLKQRGEGQLFGARQSGMPQLRMARVLEHQDIVKVARDEAVAILDADPELRAFEHQWIAQEMRDRFPDGALDVVQSG
ncbi:MAG TPA: ATP-dependent DNA helicase RecG [Actinomycetota bacterium]|nr:ATP-dependent DNA helicase RecG [Actinomycetota bacterium]